MTKKKSSDGRRPQIPELLAPAGNLEKLMTAVHYGADAVYLGGESFSLRAKAGNFTVDEIAEGIEFARQHGCRVYVTVNIIAHENDFPPLRDYLGKLSRHRPDALIISDPGILQLAQRYMPEVPLHLSTQANVTNSAAARFWFSQGVHRINLAREMSLAEIADVRHAVDGELEVFVHGALCISYSGRCMLSNYLTGRDANQGQCSHPCRFSYSLVEEKRPGEYFPVEEDGRGTYIFNSKDLCLMGVLPQLVAVGVDSLKIEGRMKSLFYVGGVVRAYRAALDYLAGLPDEAWKDPEKIVLPQELMAEIAKTGTRGMSENFFSGAPTPEAMLYHTSRAEQMVEPVAVVRSDHPPVAVEIRNRLFPGEQLEYMGRGMDLQRVVVRTIVAEDGERLDVVNPGRIVRLETEPPLHDCERYGLLRRRKAPAGGTTSQDG